MAQPTTNHLTDRLRSELGENTNWTSPSDVNAALWTFPGYELICAEQLSSKSGINRLWSERWNNRAIPVILIATSDAGTNRVNVLGPDEAHRSLRELPAQQVVDLLRDIRDCDQIEAHERLTNELSAMAESITPGLRANGLLTTHFMSNRLRLPENATSLQNAVNSISTQHLSTGWRDLVRPLGYEIEDQDDGNYLLRHQNSPIAIIRPYPEVIDLNRMNDSGQLPEGVLLVACQRAGAPWGILTAEGRYRLFQQNPKTGAATGQWLEIHPQALSEEDRLYVGLLSPQSLRQDGWMSQWSEEARDFGDELRRGLEERISNVALPQLARGLAEWLQSQGVDVNNREQLDEIGRAALTLTFRYMFVLHLEAREHLPIRDERYRRDSAATLADDCRTEHGPFDRNSVRRWQGLQKLTGMMRNGDQSAQVPAYNGGLFSPDRFPGSSLLESAQISDQRLAPAIAAIAFENDGEDAPGLDYAGLQVGHLGAIYEALLSYQLSIADEDLIYDAKKDIFRPKQASDKHTDVQRSELLYQTEKGGRKAGGVYYTRHEFVQHLLNHSLLPALDDHLKEVETIAVTSTSDAAQHLFKFSIIDPAMGSAHFLTAALDMMADHVELFLVNHPLPPIAEMLRELRQDAGESAANTKDGDLLRRLILKRCIYGVDVSPMAVEIANVTLWLSSFVPGLALSYLGNNLKCGDALIGVADPSVVGTKDPIFTGIAVRNAMRQAADLQTELVAISDRTPDEVRQSAELNGQVRESTAGLRAAFDLWAAQPLGLADGRNVLTLHAKAIIDGDRTNIADAITEAEAVAAQYNFFHWPLEFPTVFHAQHPGFHVVVGNPPWNEITVEELAFYALREPGLRGLSELANRRKHIAVLDQQNPHWRAEFEAQQQHLATMRKFFSESGGYQLQGVGDTDLYQLFCERYSNLVRQDGRLGVVLPRSAFLAQGATGFRQWLFNSNGLRRLDLLLNNRSWAFNIHPQYTIALLTAQRRKPTAQACFQITGPSANQQQFEVASRSQGISIPTASLGNTRVVPLMPSQMHADVLAKLRRGVQFDALRNPQTQESSTGRAVASHLVPYTELHETQQRAIFSHADGIAVWKGRSFNQYDPHGNEPAGYAVWDDLLTYVQRKRARSPIFKRMFTSEVLANPITHPLHHPRVAFRNIARATDSRTSIACLIPPRTPLTNAAPYLVFGNWSPVEQAFVLGILNSIPFDWFVRRYIETTFNFYILNMLCFPSPDATRWQSIGQFAARLSCVDDRFADFAAEAGVEFGPLPEGDRDDMRAEIDALVANAYGLSADELRFVFTDFTDNAVPQSYRDLVITKFEQEQPK